MTEHAPLIIDVAGTQLTATDRQRLAHPLVGGVILFARNWEHRAQLLELTAAIKAVRSDLLICVDHEGGRVQRFRTDGFTHIPAMAALGELWMNDGKAGAGSGALRAMDAATAAGYVLGAELRACGVDFSFTPVLDLDYGPSRVIGDRALHRDPAVVIALAAALGEGLHAAGMGSCGKHFPGHGYVIPDSHVELPVDDRSLAAMAEDLRPYRELPLDAVMAAHVIYSCVDCHTAVFSRRWLDFLRQDLGFDGVIFTDDLSMAGAGVVGNMLARVEAAWTAGCDMLLLCNAPEAVGEVLAHWRPQPDTARAQRVARLVPEQPCCYPDPHAYREALNVLATLGGSPGQP